ncbi:Trigger factor [Rubripirellula lacrimiformis]|uniref:Trigger factor n=1 Tax=Rubripirellula lacrimiformis TaxID=1930273 RepID=A0A517NF64_9BACT|nr:trigger factor [Rubripirellula lacrimiformis]QDT05770.1 Trigger factor [Rubripirellula lacrimiformis]
MSTSTENQLTDVAEEKAPLKLEIKVESPQACLREVIVTIPHSEVERYLKDAYDELVPEAQVPGFRSGRAPRKLVEKQFRDRVEEQVKGALLMDSLAQVTEDDSFNAIGEPDFDYNSIKIPASGDFKFQFQIEVRPEFKTPEWKGMSLNKPVEEIADEDVQEALDRVLARYGSLEGTDAPAETGDKLLITAKFKKDGKVLSTMDEERVDLNDRLSLSDGVCEDFGSLMTGVKEGETRKGKVKVADGASDEAMQGQEVDAEFHVVEVLKLELPEMTEEFLGELGDFESEQELRDFVRDSLTRQADYRTQQAVRKTVVDLLTGSADFELPATLVRRQTARELERKVLELRRSGFDDDMIRRFVNASRQNAQATTESALREHFILEQIAEEEKIDAEEADYAAEIALIAQQSDMPERRVRARLEKQGQMDALRNQIVERKVIELVVESAKVTEEPVDKKTGEEGSEFAVYHNVLPTKDAEVIPTAKYDDGSAPDTEKKPTERDTED